MSRPRRKKTESSPDKLPVTLPPELPAFLDYLRYDKGRSPGTVVTYRHYLKRHFEWLMLAGADYREPSLPDAEAFRAWLTRTDTRFKRKIARSTANSLMAAVSEFYRWLLRGAGRPNPYQDKDLRFDTRARRQDPGRRSPGGGASRALTPKERNVVLTWMRKRLADRDGVRIPLLLMYGAGLRVSEAAQIKGNALLKGSDGLVWITLRGKGGKVRTTAIFDKELGDEITRYAATRESEPLATVKRETLLAWAARCRADTGVDFTTHRLRHTFGTERISEDMPIDVLQKLLGHDDIKTTRGYADTVDERVRSVVRAITKSRRQSDASRR